jgi:hypothetical protein
VPRHVDDAQVGVAIDGQLRQLLARHPGMTTSVTSTSISCHAASASSPPGASVTS